MFPSSSRIWRISPSSRDMRPPNASVDRGPEKCLRTVVNGKRNEMDRIAETLNQLIRYTVKLRCEIDDEGIRLFSDSFSRTSCETLGNIL